MKKSLKTLAVLVMILSLLQMLPVTARASVKYFETAKDNVPLRFAKGDENSVVDHIKDKGTVVEILKSEKKHGLWGNTWYKVRVSDRSLTSNNNSGEFWIWSDNLKHSHSHTMVMNACSAPGCSYVIQEKVTKFEKEQYRVVSRDNAPVRPRPYDDAGVSKRLNKGVPLSIVAEVVNSRNNLWYQLRDGTYIYSGNTVEGTKEDLMCNSNSCEAVKNSGSPAVSKYEYFQPLPKSPCLVHKWSVGACVNCGMPYNMTVTAISGTFKTSEDNAVARRVPYQQGEVTRTFGAKGTLVQVNGIAQNSAGNTWYRTTDNDWIYRVENVNFRNAYLTLNGGKATSYTFQSMDQTPRLRLMVEPTNAEVTIKWTSSDSTVVMVDSDGNLRAVGAGKTIVSCQIHSAEGNAATLQVDIVVPEAATLETWNYDNQRYENDLALECAQYMALAYPDSNYMWDDEQILVYASSGSSVPVGLTDLLSQRKMRYETHNFHNKLPTNSPFVLADKLVNYNGKVTPLVYVIITGSAGLEGWQGNMMVAGTSNDISWTSHYTFQTSATEIKNTLYDYLHRYNRTRPLVVVTGHSRGGAVANLLAAELTAKEDLEAVYAYTFATPNTTKAPQKYRNIYNICNEGDFVAFIPLSQGWGYKKHGITYTFNASQLYLSNSTFRSYITQLMGMGNGRDKPDYTYCMMEPFTMRNYLSGNWPSLEAFYHSKVQCPDSTAYQYFHNGLAAVASREPARMISGGAEMIKHFHGCALTLVTTFFIGNAANTKLASAFIDSHQPQTYYAAILANAVNKYDHALLFDAEDSEKHPGKLDETEEQALQAFFRQGENPLMLETAGWNLSEPSTWEGVSWNAEGHVEKLDLSYLNLSGWLNVSGLSELKELNIDGNEISVLAVNGCEKLETLSCFYNRLQTLDVRGCSQLSALNCACNQITSLDADGMSALKDLNCYGNALSSLNLNGATALETLRCGDNELSTLDLSTNSSLSTLFCQENYLIEAANPELSALANEINESGGNAEIGRQKYIPDFAFDEQEVENLRSFANASLNQEALQWDLDDPWSWRGITWKIYGDHYHVTEVDFNGIEVEGDLNLPDAAYLESLNCDNTGLTQLNLSGCGALSSVNCENARLSALELEKCESLTSIHCDGNYLEVEEVRSSLNQLGLQNGLVSYERQNLDADDAEFDNTELEVLRDFLNTGENAEVLQWDWEWPGTWSGISWILDDNGFYRVNQLDLSDLPVTGALDMTGFAYLEDFHFKGTSLESVTLPDCLTKIPEAAFYGSKICNVLLREGITRIESAAFAYCQSLQNVILPASLSALQNSAFMNCSSLENAVFLGNCLLEVGEDIFSGCASAFQISVFGETFEDGGALTTKYLCCHVQEDYLLMFHQHLSLSSDSLYGPENQYAGDDVSLVVITHQSALNVVCFLAIYNEEGKFVSVAQQELKAETSSSILTFQNVNLQFVGENSCHLKAFLLDEDYRPLSMKEMILLKPDES